MDMYGYDFSLVYFFVEDFSKLLICIMKYVFFFILYIIIVCVFDVCIIIFFFNIFVYYVVFVEVFIGRI